MALILIVDDDELMLGVLKMFLQGEGYEVVTAMDGNKALGIVNSVELDLAISDIRMRPMNGMEFLSQARQAKPELPVIMLTAYCSPETAKQARELGAYAYLSKPFSNDEVLSMVAGALKSGGAGAAPTG